ncbi:30S ribosomal protein S11 [Aplysia californica]|uniref:30S ribosomal protein S11 n=1 Tax=Aplysia californica TaxID=6500 RepID=A0ABM0JN19_APLCA|nr:30S ribosomal protein S11 [Aplysia californica]
MNSFLQRIPFTCAVRACKRQGHELLYRNICTSAVLEGGYKRYDRSKDSVRQADESYDSHLVPKDKEPLTYDKTYGTTSFPTTETHNQHFNGIRYLDIPVVHIKSTSNNTIISATDGQTGQVFAIQSAGTVGFRNARKGTNVAAQAAAIALAGDVQRKDVKTVRVCLKGIGPGRLPALKAIQMSGINVASITDTTPLPHNGNRPKKARRL